MSETLIDPLVAQVRRICKQASRKQLQASLEKAASLGGEPTDGFEKSFASLAYTYLQDKAPGLLDHMVGFQLVDRAPDNKKAIGIFGFKVGDQWMYVPVFFLAGRLKGHELLYLKNQDKFVPLKEKWVNYVTSRKQHALGTGVSESLQQLGGASPDLLSFSVPPMLSNRKFGTDLKPWVKASGMLPSIAKWVTDIESCKAIEFLKTRNPKFASDVLPQFNLEELLSSSLDAVKVATDICQAYPAIRDGLFRAYDSRILSRCATKAIKAAEDREVEASKPVSIFRARQQKQAAAKPAITSSSILAKSAVNKAPEPTAEELRKAASEKVEIYTEGDAGDHTLSDDEKSKLLQQGYVIRDNRTSEEVSSLYSVIETQAFTNPDRTGVYKVLTKPRQLEKALVVVGPQGSRRKNFVAVVTLEGKKKYGNYSSTEVFVAPVKGAPAETDTYLDWFKNLDNAGSNLSSGGCYVCVGAGGDGTTVFEVEEKIGEGLYRVHFRDYTNSGPHLVCHEGPRPMPSWNDEEPCRFIRLNEREGTGLRQLGDTLYVPNTAKFVEVAPAPKCRKCGKTRGECDCEYFSSRYESTEPVEPGSLADVSLELLQKKAGFKIIVDHCDVYLGHSTQPLSKMAALMYLVKEAGFREGEAKSMLKQAERRGGKRFLAKFANPYMTMEGGFAPMMMNEPVPQADPAWGNVPVQPPYEDSQIIQGIQAGNTDMSIYDPMKPLDQQTAQMAQQASQSGRKELLDSSMFASLLNATSDESRINRHMGSFMKTVDGLGRMLLSLNWHYDDFADRYGKKDMPELEDTLKNNFEGMGDLVLYLKEKNIDPLQSSEDQPELQNS